jgi:hypothetical protein
LVGDVEILVEETVAPKHTLDQRPMGFSISGSYSQGPIKSKNIRKLALLGLFSGGVIVIGKNETCFRVKSDGRLRIMCVNINDATTRSVFDRREKEFGYIQQVCAETLEMGVLADRKIRNLHGRVSLEPLPFRQGRHFLNVIFDYGSVVGITDKSRWG